MVTCCPQGILASGHRAEACWLPTGSADREALQEFPGAGGLQHAADGARAGPAGEHERRRHPPGERPRHIPLQPLELDPWAHFVAG